jgi:hypothetical protein
MAAHAERRDGPMGFREAVERLTDRPTRRDIAAALGVSTHTVRQGLLPDTSAAARPAPRAWPETIARLAKEGAERLAALAHEIEQGGDDGTRTG